MYQFKLKHFLITRFNVKRVPLLNPERSTLDKNSKTVLTNEWMDKRFKLFQNYCLPSITSQSNQEFIWLIYFGSEDTKPKYKQLIQNLSQDNSCFIAKYVKDSREMNQAVKTDISKLIDKETDFLITTRIDNDDALHEDAIEKIQKTFYNNIDELIIQKQYQKIGINLKKGYCLQVEPYFEITKHELTSSPFVSLVEKLDHTHQKFYTVISQPHQSFTEQTEFPLIQIDNYCYWIQVIHDNNVSNIVKGFPIYDKYRLTEFNIDIDNIYLNKIAFYKTIIRYIKEILNTKLIKPITYKINTFYKF